MMHIISTVSDEQPQTETRPIDIAAAVRRHIGDELKTYFALPTVDTLPERLAGLVHRFEMAVASRGESSMGAFRNDLMAAMPSLRTYAYSLAGNMSLTDDLVQETLMKAWSNQHRFQPGSNLIAWLFTILRNQFYTDIRKRRREVEDADGVEAGKRIVVPEQEGVIALRQLHNAMATLPSAQREALVLIGAEGFTYEEAAVRLRCEVGTVKSRVSRARAQLAGLLRLDTEKTMTAMP